MGEEGLKDRDLGEGSHLFEQSGEKKGCRMAVCLMERRTRVLG